MQRRNPPRKGKSFSGKLNGMDDGGEARHHKEGINQFYNINHLHNGQPPPSYSAKTYDDRLKAVSAISKPLANKKLTKKLYKLVKKASSSKYVKRGVKEVVKVRFTACRRIDREVWKNL